MFFHVAGPITHDPMSKQLSVGNHQCVVDGNTTIHVVQKKHFFNIF